MRNGKEHQAALQKALYFIEYNEIQFGFEKSSLRKMMEAIWAQLADWHYIYPGKYQIEGKDYDGGYNEHTGNYTSKCLNYFRFNYGHTGGFHSYTYPMMEMFWDYVSEEVHDSNTESNHDSLLRAAIYAVCELLCWLYEELQGENPNAKNLPNSPEKSCIKEL